MCIRDSACTALVIEIFAALAAAIVAAAAFVTHRLRGPWIPGLLARFGALHSKGFLALASEELTGHPWISKVSKRCLLGLGGLGLRRFAGSMVSEGVPGI
eukprot:819871-Pyramimonas_sp.AAC.1